MFWFCFFNHLSSPLSYDIIYYQEAFTNTIGDKTEMLVSGGQLQQLKAPQVCDVEK